MSLEWDKLEQRQEFMSMYFPRGLTDCKEGDFKIGQRIAHIIGTYGIITSISTNPFVVLYRIEGVMHFYPGPAKPGEEDGSGCPEFLYHCNAYGLPSSPQEDTNRFENIDI